MRKLDCLDIFGSSVGLIAGKAHHCISCSGASLKAIELPTGSSINICRHHYPAYHLCQNHLSWNQPYVPPGGSEGGLHIFVSVCISSYTCYFSLLWCGWGYNTFDPIHSWKPANQKTGTHADAHQRHQATNWPPANIYRCEFLKNVAVQGWPTESKNSSQKINQNKTAKI